MLGNDHCTLYSALNVSHNATAKSNRQPMLTKQYSLSAFADDKHGFN